uniref:Variant surface glycoprotein 1125.5536 n=1 Tax=Trypanosoma brucei TaxID=5691 RepID=A0A1J0RCK5_9TRYP|nr:variant surface glycoprotein 1125.5536 [Trypanosoma brucei]
MYRIRAAFATTLFFVVCSASADQTDNCTSSDDEAIYVSKLLAPYTAAAIENTDPEAKAAKLRIAAALTKDQEQKKKFLPLAMVFAECARQRSRHSLKAAQTAAAALTDLAFAGGMAAATRTLAQLQIANINAYDAGTEATKRDPVYPSTFATGLRNNLCSITEAAKSPTAKAETTGAKNWKLVYHIVKAETNTARANAAATAGKATICLSKDGTCKDNANNGAFYSLQAGTIFTVAENAAEPKHGHNSAPARKETIWHAQSAEEAQLAAKLDADAHTAIAVQTSNVPG